MYQKQILMEKLKEATASVLPISLIVMAISFVLVPVDAGLMLSFVIATAMLILGMGLFTLGADMSMSRIGNYMGSKLTKSRKLPLILTVSFALGVAITVAEPDLQVLAGNVPEIDTTVLILTVSVGVGFFLMLCMVRILFSISLRTMLIVFYAIVFAALKAAHAAGDADKVAKYAELLYDQALLIAGLPIEDPVAYAQLVCGLMQ